MFARRRRLSEEEEEEEEEDGFPVDFLSLSLSLSISRLPSTLLSFHSLARSTPFSQVREKKSLSWPHLFYGLDLTESDGLSSPPSFTQCESIFRGRNKSWFARYIVVLRRPICFLQLHHLRLTLSSRIVYCFLE